VASRRVVETAYSSTKNGQRCLPRNPKALVLLDPHMNGRATPENIPGVRLDLGTTSGADKRKFFGYYHTDYRQRKELSFFKKHLPILPMMGRRGPPLSIRNR